MAKRRIRNNPINDKTKNKLGFSRFTYADFIILSSSLAAAVADDLTIEDLDFLLTFIDLFASDLGLIRIKRGYEQMKGNTSQSIEEIMPDQTNTQLDINTEEDITTRCSNEKVRKKKIKRVRRKK